MKIEIEELDGGVGSLDHQYEPGEIVLDEEHARLTQPPHFHGNARRGDDSVEIRGTITAVAEVDCDRCLKSVEVPISTSFDVKYAPASRINDEEAHELAEDDLALSFFEGEMIDIDELVREQVLLSLPSRALCNDDCKGLCPVCGADKNAVDSCGCETTEIDPRWAALKNLK